MAMRAATRRLTRRCSLAVRAELVEALACMRGPGARKAAGGRARPLSRRDAAVRAELVEALACMPQAGAGKPAGGQARALSRRRSAAPTSSARRRLARSRGEQ